MHNQHPQPVESLGLCCHSVVLPCWVQSCREITMLHRPEIFKVSPMEAFVQEWDRQVLGFVATSEGSHSHFSCELSPCYPRKGKMYPTPSYRLASNTHNGKLFELALPSPGDPVPLSSVLGDKGCAAQSWGIKSMSPLKAIVWDQNKVFGFQWETLWSVLLNPEGCGLCPELGKQKKSQMK